LCDVLCSFGAKVISAEVATIRSCSHSSRGMVADRQCSEGSRGRGQFGRRPTHGHCAACGRSLPRDRRIAARRGQQHVQCESVGETESATDCRQLCLRKPRLKYFSLQRAKYFVPVRQGLNFLQCWLILVICELVRLRYQNSFSILYLCDIEQISCINIAKVSKQWFTHS